MKKINKQNAEKYWWYRMIKIVYILVVIVCGIIAFSLIKNGEYGYFPKTDFYTSSYGYQCTKGSTYKGGNFPSSYFDFDISKNKNQVYTLNYYGISSISYSNLMNSDDIFKKICFSGKVPDSIESLVAQPVPSDSQSAYRFIMTEEVKDKTLGNVFWQWGVILFCILIVLRLVPKVFSYILFGKEGNNSDLE